MQVWFHEQFPLIPIGNLILNRNVNSWFAETEQVAFNPAHVVPGIELSNSKILQGDLCKKSALITPLITHTIFLKSKFLVGGSFQ